MKIAVYGAGAVGGYFGGRLAQAGHEVVFIARGDQLEALRTSGLRVESPEGTFHLEKVAATDNPGTVGPVDAILVATKAWQVPEAAKAIAPMIGRTVIVGLQNGVEAADQLRREVDGRLVIGGVSRIIARRGAPGVIIHGGGRPSVTIGEFDGRASDRCQRLVEAFLRAKGLDAFLAEDIQAEIWRKFLFISAVSGVGSISRAPIGVMRAQPETRWLIEIVMREIRAVAKAHGVDLPREAVAASLKFLDSLPADGMSSMQQDIAEGRPSELDSQNGAVVRLGREKGVPTPINEGIQAALLPLERRARGELEF